MACLRDQISDGFILDGCYQSLSLLNRGSYGMVFLARDLTNNDLVALKCLTKSASDALPLALDVDERSEELAVHARIGRHPNIVNLLNHFDTERHFFLVLEFCANGDLYEAIRSGRGPLETAHVRHFMHQLVDAVDFLHSKSLYHRDIKPENIFLTQSGSVKLGDFGLATTEQISFESAVGSDRYMAPEQYDHSGNGYSPAKADIWAIGICLLNILFSRNPFASPTISDPLFADFLRDRQSLFDVFPHMSQDTFEVLMQCLAVDPAKRSLSGMREALNRVISFTTDDGIFDDFCTTDRDPVPASANREPLRTPSISATAIEGAAAFPWARALRMTTQHLVRQLSAIPDNESSKAAEEDEERTKVSRLTDQEDWFIVKPDDASVFSFVDSGLGYSYQSRKDLESPAKSDDEPTLGALPIGRSLAKSVPIPAMRLVFGGKPEVASKSWSEMWDEDEENSEAEIENLERSGHLTVPDEGQTRFSLTANAASNRSGLAELKDPSIAHNSRARSPDKSITTASANSPCKETPRPKHMASFERPLLESRYRRQSSPSGKRPAMDKWTALGERRRGLPSPSPERPPPMPVLAPTPSGARKRPRSRAPSWRRNTKVNAKSFVTPQHEQDVYGSGPGFPLRARRDLWNLSKDWRAHDEQVLPAMVTTLPLNDHDHLDVKAAHHIPQPFVLSHKNISDPAGTEDDIGELEWVGGWHDFHL